jgi:predicted TIM-barrel fold metal-dependent hydrolase
MRPKTVARRDEMPAFPYFALAEQLDIPVAIHRGTGGAEVQMLPCPSFGDPTAIRLRWNQHLVPGSGR